MSREQNVEKMISNMEERIAESTLGDFSNPKITVKFLDLKHT